MKDVRKMRYGFFAGTSAWASLKTLCFLLCALCLSCSSSGKDDADEQVGPESWYVSIRGKVGYPQPGQITIHELKEGGSGFQDTVKLNSDYTFNKRVKLTEPGYYRLNFYNKQMVDVI